MDIQVNSTKQKLVNSIEDLIDSLKIELDRLNIKENYVPNSLGVIQASGATIDVLCGKYATLVEIKKLIDLEE